MKKLKNLSFLLLFGLLCSCQNQKDQEQQQLREQESAEKDSIETAQNLAHCYLFENGKDTIKMSYNLHQSEVKGWLVYNFFEKDGSFGEIDGEFFGDTLKLDYEFLSEGKLSEQKVYFLLNKGKLYRGSGEMKMDADSTMVYSNPAQISFEDTTHLTDMEDCPEDFIDPTLIDFFKKEEEKN